MNKTIKYSSLVFLLLLGLTSINQVQGKGKTYDDLDDILKHDGLNSTKTHVAHQEAMESGAHIDPNKVVHRPPPQINEDRAVTSGVVIPKAYTSSNSASRKSGSQTKTYEQYAKKNDGFDDQSLPLRYLKIPKRDRDAQFYFFLSTLLLLATTITIISSCGCLFYFLLKNLVSMQERMVDDSESPDNQGQNAGSQGQSQQQRNNNQNFQRFEDEEDQRNEESKKQQQDLPRLLNGAGRSGPNTLEFKQ
eukprot:403362201